MICWISSTFFRRSSTPTMRSARMLREIGQVVHGQPQPNQVLSKRSLGLETKPLPPLLHRLWVHVFPHPSASPECLELQRCLFHLSCLFHVGCASIPDGSPPRLLLLLLVCLLIPKRIMMVKINSESGDLL